MNIKFRDTFKILDLAKTNVNNLASQVNRALNSALPNRVLSRSNIFNMSISVARDLATMVILQLEDNLVEQNILVAQKETSVRGLSTLAGHNATRALSSNGVVKIKFKKGISNITGSSVIFNGTKFRSIQNGLTYVMKESIKSVYTNNDDDVFLSLIEGEYADFQYVAEGLPLEKIELDNTSAIENGNITVKVNGVPFTEADSLYDMPKGTKSFITKNGIGNQVDIIFGNDVFGVLLKDGDVVDVRYLLTNGEDGNVSTESTFEIDSGVYGSNGVAVSINDYAHISISSGFQLGSNGEHIDTTRLMAGMTSRSMVFARPENLQAYLSRLTILSYINVWCTPDDLVFKMLLLPNLKNKLKTYSEYYSLGVEDMKLNDGQKSAILDYINTSGSQITTTEFEFVDPIFEKYAIFLYVNGDFVDKGQARNKIYEAVAQYMLEKTFLSNISIEKITIPMGELINRLVDSVDEIEEVNINIISERNEAAKINGYYYKSEIVVGGSSKKKISVRYNLKDGENPNIGFNELGSISPTDQNSIPILSKGFHTYNQSGNFKVEKPIYIFHKNINGDYEEL